MQEEPERNVPVRNFSGATAEFGDGGEVLKIALISDFSTVRISGLPLNSSPESIANSLNGLGFDVTLDSATISISQSGFAYLKVEDPSFATKFASRVQESTNVDSTLQLKATPITISSQSPTGSSGISSNKVHCSWHKLTQPVWLNYGTGEIAERVSAKFGDGRYRILGGLVKCGAPKESTTFTSRRGKAPRTSFNPRAWTVMLTDIPANATKMDIDEAIKMPFDKPRHIEMGSSGGLQDDETTYAIVKSLLTEIGPLEWWERMIEATGKRSKAKARFEEQSDAREAVASLDGKSVASLNNRKLTISLVYTSKFKIATTIYDTVQVKIEAFSKNWAEEYIYVTAYRNTDLSAKFTVLRIEGESFGAVYRAKVSLEQILEGNIAMYGKMPLWSQSLSSNGPAFQKLKQIQRDVGVIINRNKRLSQLHIYGSVEKRIEAERRLLSFITNESLASHTIELSPNEFSWALNGGFRSVIAALGEDKATFDVVSKPKKIRVTGSQNEYDTAVALVKGQATDTKLKPTITSDCVVCYTEAENPIRTSCDHVYCLDCFENLCAAGGSDEKDFQLRCCGAAGTCNVVFPLKEIQEHLSSAAFEDILKASFSSYVCHRPDAFRYCPSPDCGSVYRAASEPSQHKCAKCGVATCRCCHNPYLGLTCAEHREHATGGYEMLEKFKKEHGIKDCPKCGTPMEKTEGCNHMTCKGCGVHICWVCLQTFTTSAPCYEHMKQKHGGIGLDYLL